MHSLHTILWVTKQCKQQKDYEIHVETRENVLVTCHIKCSRVVAARSRRGPVDTDRLDARVGLGSVATIFVWPTEVMGGQSGGCEWSRSLLQTSRADETRVRRSLCSRSIHRREKRIKMVPSCQTSPTLATTASGWSHSELIPKRRMKIVARSRAVQRPFMKT